MTHTGIRTRARQPSQLSIPGPAHTLAEPAAAHGVHPHTIKAWRRAGIVSAQRYNPGSADDPDAWCTKPWLELAASRARLVDFVTVEDGLRLQFDHPLRPDDRTDRARGRLDADAAQQRLHTQVNIHTTTPRRGPKDQPFLMTVASRPLITLVGPGDSR